MPNPSLASVLLVAVTACGGGLASRASQPSIRGVDFLNRSYDAALGEEPETVTVRRGEFGRPDDADGNRAGYFHVAPPVYGDVDGDGREDATVITHNSTGGTGVFDDARVFSLRGGEVVQIAVVPGGDRGDGGLRAVTPEPGGLRVERYVPGEGDGACCASKLAVEHWRWQANKLVLDETSVEIGPNPDLKP